MEQGNVLQVNIYHVGDEIAVDALLGATTLTVYDVSDFSETGGQLTVNGVVYTYTEIDQDLKTIVITSALTGDALLGTPVHLYPLAEEKHAMVQLTAAIDDDAIIALIPHNLQDKFEDGIREEAKQESVLLDLVYGQWQIVDVGAKIPSISGFYIDPVGLPPAVSDGSPPASSPTPTAIGGLGAIFLRWDALANNDPIRYKLHGSTTIGFTIDPGNLIIDTPGSSYTHRPTSPDYTATYYYRLLAYDDDGDAVTASPEVSAQMVQVNGPDINVNYAYVGMISALQILTSELTADLTVSGTIKTANTGQRVEINGPMGIQHVRPDGTLSLHLPTHPTDAVPPFIRGQFRAESLTVEDNLSVEGTGNELAVGAELMLAYQPGDPTSPPIASPSIPNHASGIPGDESFHLPTGWSIGDSDEYHSWKFFNDSGIYKRATGVLSAGTSFITATASPGADDFVVDAMTHYYETAATEERLIVFGVRKTDSLRCFRKYDITAWPPTKVVDYAYDDINPFHRVGLGPSVNDNEFCEAQVTTDNKIRFRRYAANSSIVSQTTSAVLTELSNGVVPKEVYGAMYGDFGLGVGNLYCAFMRDRVWFVNPGTGARESTYDFYTSANIVAGTHKINSSRDYVSFHAVEVGDTPRSFDYTEYGRAGSVNGTTIFGMNTWYDSVGTTHETKASKQWRQFTLPKRGQVVMSVPSIPVGAAGADDPDSVRFYLGTSTPNANLWSQDSPPAAGVLSQTLTNPRTATGGGATNPPTSNNFPTQTPAKILAPSGTMKIQGDGTIDANPLSENNRRVATGMKGAVFSGNTNVNGQVTITHGLPVTPTYAVAMVHGSNNYFCALVSLAATTFVVVVNHRTAATNVLVSSAVTLSWIAGY